MIAGGLFELPLSLSKQIMKTKEKLTILLLIFLIGSGCSALTATGQEAPTQEILIPTLVAEPISTVPATVDVPSTMIPATAVPAIPATPILATSTPQSPPPTVPVIVPSPTASPLPPPPLSVGTEVQYVQMRTDVNVRRGPGIAYQVVNWLAVGHVAQVTGISPDGGWWEISCQETATQRCWVTGLEAYVVPFSPPDTTGATRIKFQPDMVLSSVSGEIGAGESGDRYVLNGAVGQWMVVRVRSEAYSNTGLKIQGVDDWRVITAVDQDPGYFEIYLHATQDYLFSIERKAAGPAFDYSMDIAITDTDYDAEPRELIFTADGGMAVATMNGHLSPFAPQTFVFEAGIAQFISVNVSSDSGLANFSLTGLSDGQPYKRLANEDRFWQGISGATQDYLLTLALPPEADGTFFKFTVVTATQMELPEIINEYPIPDELCVAHQLGGDGPSSYSIPVLAGPGEGYVTTALLYNWSEVLSTTLDWHKVRISETEIGWVDFDLVQILGPCAAPDPMRGVAFYDPIGELPPEQCHAQVPAGMPVVPIRATPEYSGTLLAALVTHMPVAEIEEEWVRLDLAPSYTGWVPLDRVDLIGSC